MSSGPGVIRSGLRASGPSSSRSATASAGFSWDSPWDIPPGGFSEKYAVLSGDLLQKLDQTQGGAPPSDEELASTWSERNDAQNYIVLGDPAVRLAVNKLQAP